VRGRSEIGMKKRRRDSAQAPYGFARRAVQAPAAHHRLHFGFKAREMEAVAAQRLGPGRSCLAGYALQDFNAERLKARLQSRPAPATRPPCDARARLA